MPNCLILDDYQNAALGLADWGRLDGVNVSTVTEYIGDREALVARIEQAEILVIMRERTPFPADLLARLPKLKLLVTSGMRNASIDLAAAEARGVTVCGTDSSPTPPTELTWALILGLARFRRPIRDYFTICDSYFKAVRSEHPRGIEAIDMARRGLHNEGAELLLECLDGKVEMDFDTARRLFTLICVLHIKQSTTAVGQHPPGAGTAG